MCCEAAITGLVDLTLFVGWQWEPSHRGYLQFLAESQVVYNTLDGIIAEASHPECKSPHLQQQQSAFSRKHLALQF